MDSHIFFVLFPRQIPPLGIAALDIDVLINALMQA